MKIRDMHATLSDDKTEYEMPSGGLDILADDGRVLFCIIQNGDKIEITTSCICKQGNKLLDRGMTITPRYINSIEISRAEYR